MLLMDARPVLDHHQRAWLSGNYATLARELAAERVSPGRELLLAQVYLRIGRHQSVLDLLGPSLAVPDFFNPVERVRALSLEGVALAAQGQRRRAEGALRQIGLRDRWQPAVNVEIRLNDALVYWMLGETAHADALVSDHLFGPDSRIDPYVTARFVMLQSWIRAASEDYHGQARSLIDAIRRLQRAPEQDAGLLAWGVHALATLVRDIDIPEGFAVAQEVEAAISWTPDLAMQRFRTGRALAWCLALQGDYIRAFRKLEEVRPFARDAVDNVLVHLDRAHVAFISGQEAAARGELQAADRLIRSEDWSAPATLESGALLHAAELFSGVDAHRAEELLALAADIRRGLARNMAIAHDRRYGATANFTEALIREAVPGRRETARLRALKAFEVFAEIGYNWRAARAAILLHAITGEQQWIARAGELCRSYPRSFVAQEAARRVSEGASPVDRLTVRQRHIYQLVRQGKSTDQIGMELGISPNTVRIHLGRIYGAFGVRSRTQLLKRVS